ncbi:MAG: hypothetical protein Q9201_001588 [Fulgogasparrea decipioides]
MVVPLRDQNGRVRYYLGAQLDITELVNNSTGLDSLRKLVSRQCGDPDQQAQDNTQAHVDLLTEFQQLSETFTAQELQSLLRSQQRQEMDDQVKDGSDHLKGYQSRSVRIRNSSANLDSSIQLQGFGSAPPLGFYQNYLLVRPHPSLRILFASPDLRVPGILQSPLMHQIGGSPRVRDDLYHALEAGRKVTAKVQWLSKSFHDGRARWIHCTPLISANGLIGVWMVILVDDDGEPPVPIKRAQPEPVPTTTAPSDIPQPTPWGSVKVNRSHQNESGGSSSTSDSSQTAFSDSAVKLPYEKIPPIHKEIHDTVPLPFASTKHRGSNSSAAISTTEFKPEAPPIEYDDLRRSPDSLPPPRNPNRPQFNSQPPDTQPFAVRPGPRIAGRAYSFVSNSDPGNDERHSVSSRGNDRTRPTSRESTIAALQPPDLQWRKVDDVQPGVGVPGRGEQAPIKLPGRLSKDSAERPPVRKTKKSLSPYGFLFE